MRDGAALMTAPDIAYNIHAALIAMQMAIIYKIYQHKGKLFLLDILTLYS